MSDCVVCPAPVGVRISQSPPLVDQLREAHAHIEVELLPPVGQHRLFRELLHKIAVQTAD